MATYSPERKRSVLNKLLPPHNMSVAVLAKQEGITEATLYNWRKQAKNKGAVVPGNQPNISDDWSSESKLSVVMETATFNQAELSEYCRQKGLYPEQIQQWKQQFIAGFALHSDGLGAGHEQLKYANKKIKTLEKDLRRKEKALAEAAALLVLQKKFNALWEDEAQ
jgi:transposase